MKNYTETDIKKISINEIIATQHPVTICWLLASFFLICSMYAYSCFTL